MNNTVLTPEREEEIKSKLIAEVSRIMQSEIREFMSSLTDDLGYSDEMARGVSDLNQHFTPKIETLLTHRLKEYKL